MEDLDTEIDKKSPNNQVGPKKEKKKGIKKGQQSHVEAKGEDRFYIQKVWGEQLGQKGNFGESEEMGPSVAGRTK